MLLDARTYTCRPGTINKHLELYERLGKGPQTKHLGNPLAYMKCETGDPNKYMHIWMYEMQGTVRQNVQRCGPTRTGFAIQKKVPNWEH